MKKKKEKRTTARSARSNFDSKIPPVRRSAPLPPAADDSPVVPPPRFLSLRETCLRCNRSRVTIWALRKAKAFPEPEKDRPGGGRKLDFLESKISAWIQGTWRPECEMKGDDAIEES
jgi:predicted DNA-binding transcriptional regulator AlpA